MRRRFLVLWTVSAGSLLFSGCPSGANSNTFKYYIANFHDSQSLTELKMPDSDTLVMTNILTKSVPRNTMRIVELNREQFGDSLSVVEYKLEDGTVGSINARLDDGPGEVGFRLVANATLFRVDDDSKFLEPESIASDLE